MDDTIDTLMVEVRAGTSGFKSDIEAMRSTLDGTLVDGFAKAGTTLEQGLISALRRGSLGFDDLKQVAVRTLDQIAQQAVQSGLGSLGSGASGGGAGGFGSLLGSALGGLLGLPGRATGGPVSPGRSYVVGERGPELFVPTSSGRVVPNGQVTGGGKEVRVSIQLAAPRGETAPRALQRSARQVASNVRRALRDF